MRPVYETEKNEQLTIKEGVGKGGEEGEDGCWPGSPSPQLNNNRKNKEK